MPRTVPARSPNTPFAWAAAWARRNPAAVGVLDVSVPDRHGRVLIGRFYVSNGLAAKPEASGAFRNGLCWACGKLYRLPVITAGRNEHGWVEACAACHGRHKLARCTAREREGLPLSALARFGEKDLVVYTFDLT